MRSLVTLLLLLVSSTAVHAETAVERGRYLVEVLGACGNCHTPKGPQGDLRDQHLAGGFEIPEEGLGVAVASNITPDRDTGIGAWSDQEIIRAIREGKRPDGRILGPPMPFYLYRRLSDTDVRAIVAYLRTVKPVRNAVPPSRFTITLPPSWGPPVGSVPDVPRTDLVRYGEYLAGPVAHCVDCHTPRTSTGAPDETKFAAGGFAFHGPWGVSYSTNLTPDPDTGIGQWIDGRLIASLYGARQDGQRVLPPMPSHHYAVGIAEGDLKAILAYLRSLRPIRNPVPAPEPPKPK
jgi:mono/diheme cytochrome c family protein